MFDVTVCSSSGVSLSIGLQGEKEGHVQNQQSVVHNNQEWAYLLFIIGCGSLDGNSDTSKGTVSTKSKQTIRRLVPTYVSAFIWGKSGCSSLIASGLCHKHKWLLVEDGWSKRMTHNVLGHLILFIGCNSVFGLCHQHTMVVSGGWMVQTNHTECTGTPYWLPSSSSQWPFEKAVLLLSSSPQL